MNTLVVDQLAYHFHNRPLLEDISMQFKPGRLYALLGPNGSGKTTFLKILSGLLTSTHGHVYWGDTNLLQLPRLKISQILSLVPQNPVVYFDFSVYQMTAMGRYARQESQSHFSLYPIDSASQDVIEKALRQVDVWHLKDRPISMLSGGERQRVYIARALATEAPILLLDEPTSDLDLRHQLEVWHHLKTLVSGEKLVIAALHDLYVARRYCDEIVLLSHGRCVGHGRYDDVMTEDMLQGVFGVCQEPLGVFSLVKQEPSTAFSPHNGNCSERLLFRSDV